MRLLIFFFFLVFIPALTFAMPDSIATRKIHGKVYIVHEIEEAEGWFSISRKYNISYAELRLANKDSADKLIPGRTLLVPVARLKANDPHFRKNEIQYEVKEGETLFSISKKYNTSVDSLRKWNNLKEDLLIPGQQLNIKNFDDTEAEKNVVPSKSKTEKLPADNKISDLPVKSINNNAAAKKDSTKVVKTATVVSGKKPKGKIGSKPVPINKKEMSESGIASWIRDDDVNPNKYYALHRTAPIGTIIKVINKMNNRYVFVKVVGMLPDTGDNADLLIKISKASAEKLGVFDSRFQCMLNYTIIENH